MSIRATPEQEAAVRKLVHRLALAEMPGLPKLIADLEAAAEGSDLFDRTLALLFNVPWSSDEDGNFGGYNLLPRRLHFTRSFDAALTLVPEGCGWSCGLSPAGFTGSVFDPGTGCWTEECTAASPALAMCIAALRSLSTNRETLSASAEGAETLGNLDCVGDSPSTGFEKELSSESEKSGPKRVLMPELRAYTHPVMRDGDDT